MKVIDIHNFLISRLESRKKNQHYKWGYFYRFLFSQIYCPQKDSENKTLMKIIIYWFTVYWCQRI